MPSAEHFALKYLRREALPTAFCPGCFNGIVINALAKAFEEEGVEDLRNYVFVSGIGCAAWIPSPFMKVDSLHTLHGRAIPVAVGVKLANPGLDVVVVSGDGDLGSIGLGHLVHAARRNMDLAVIMVNNLVYGMTRGQQSPTTPPGLWTTTTPYGSYEYPMDVCRLLAETSANYVARWTPAHFNGLKESIKHMLFRRRRGFRFLEVVAPCTTYVSRRRGLRPGEALKELLRKSVRLEKPGKPGSGGPGERIVVGVFKDEDKPGYLDLYYSYVERARRGGTHG